MSATLMGVAIMVVTLVGVTHRLVGGPSLLVGGGSLVVGLGRLGVSKASVLVQKPPWTERADSPCREHDCREPFCVCSRRRSHHAWRRKQANEQSLGGEKLGCLGLDRDDEAGVENAPGEET